MSDENLHTFLTIVVIVIIVSLILGVRAAIGAL